MVTRKVGFGRPPRLRSHVGRSRDRRSAFAEHPASRARAGRRQLRLRGPPSARSSTTWWRKYPGLRGSLLTPDGEMHRHLNVFVNDDDVRYLGKLDAKVGDGDVVTLMPAVAGG